MIDDVRIIAELQRVGPRFDPDVLRTTRELYRAVVQEAPWAERPGIFDLPYGPGERHRIDVFPVDGNARAPIILFLHGGGFVGGDKRGDPLFYANVGRYFAAHGFLTVSANYRLAPAASWPSGIEDVAAILNWIDRSAADYGGDGSRVVFIGQSAGAAHMASYLFDRRSQAAVHASIRGAALMSGFYHAKAGMSAGPAAYFGDDDARWVARSPVTHVVPAHPPILLSVAELDPAAIAEQTLDFAAALNRVDGHPPQLVWFEGHNHVSTVHGLGVGRDLVGRALRDFAARAFES